MGEVVNLRQQRKRLEKQRTASVAANNRAKFGRTPAERADAIKVEARRKRVLDGAKVET